jgi:nitrilase
MIVDHWGEVLGRLPQGEGIVTARFDLDAQRRVRESFPALSHRRL